MAIITVAELSLWAEGSPDAIPADDPLALWLLDQASALVADECGYPAWTVATAPRGAKIVAVNVAKRCWNNADQETRSAIAGGPSSAVLDEAALGLRLSDAEIAALAKVKAAADEDSGAEWGGVWTLPTSRGPVEMDLVLVDSRAPLSSGILYLQPDLDPYYFPTREPAGPTVVVLENGAGLTLDPMTEEGSVLTVTAITAAGVFVGATQLFDLPAGSVWRITRDTTAAGGWSALRVGGGSTPDPDPDPTETTVVPLEPIFDLGGRRVVIPVATGVVYAISVNGALVTASATPGPFVIDDAPADTAVLVAAGPAAGYAFPTSPAPVVEWSATYPAVSSWTTEVTDTLADGVMEVGRATTTGGKTWAGPISADGPGATFAIVDGWLRIAEAARAGSRFELTSQVQAVQVDFDLTGAGTCSDAFVRVEVNFAWGYNAIILTTDGAGHTTLSSAGQVVAPPLTAALGESLTGLPLSGTLRVESDGVTITVLLDGVIIATAPKPADNNPGWAGEPVTAGIFVQSSYSIGGIVARARNLVLETKPSGIA